ncbi:MAG: thermonuclease family protein [Mariprofundaceae bacterium]|nr:thermonuclease family protein [Mariprofundaceae bacterium]
MKIPVYLSLFVWLVWLTIPTAMAGGTFSYIESSQWVYVDKVFDGDTFKTRKGIKIRLLGINTPEIAHGSKPGQVMGIVASKALKKWIGGKKVRLRFDRERKDRYGRTLAQVWLSDGRWVNGMLIAEGYAHVYTFAPNFRWADALLTLEKESIVSKLGIWRTRRFSLISSKVIGTKHIGEFRVVDGIVGRQLDKRGWYFNFGKLRVSVPKKYRKWFKNPPAIKHQGDRARLRGRIRVSSSGALYLALHSPADLMWSP